jgi:hypothetical protein
MAVSVSSTVDALERVGTLADPTRRQILVVRYVGVESIRDPVGSARPNA